MAEQYTGVPNLEAMEGAANYQRFLTDLIRQLGTSSVSGGTLLDFGAGVGTYARQARSAGFTVLCVEADAGLCARLQAEGFDTTTLDALPPCSQRAMYSFNVLEHIDDDIAVLRELHRIATPGGRLLLYVPAFPVLFSAMDREVGHVRRYRRAELVRKTADAGFEVNRCVYADSLGFFASLAYRMLPQRTSGILDAASVRRYDKLVFPLSRWLDTMAHRWVGKNLVLTAHRSDGDGDAVRSDSGQRDSM